MSTEKIKGRKYTLRQIRTTTVRSKPENIKQVVVKSRSIGVQVSEPSINNPAKGSFLQPTTTTTATIANTANRTTGIRARGAKGPRTPKVTIKMGSLSSTAAKGGPTKAAKWAAVPNKAPSTSQAAKAEPKSEYSQNKARLNRTAPTTARETKGVKRARTTAVGKGATPSKQARVLHGTQSQYSTPYSAPQGTQYSTPQAQTRPQSTKKTKQGAKPEQEQPKQSPSGGITIGVDEVGRGAHAGPIFVCAAMMIPIKEGRQEIERFKVKGVDDSKKITPKRRRVVFESLTSSPHYVFAIAAGTQRDISYHNVLNATKMAMAEAVKGLTTYLSEGPKGEDETGVTRGSGFVLQSHYDAEELEKHFNLCHDKHLDPELVNPTDTTPSTSTAGASITGTKGGHYSGERETLGCIIIASPEARKLIETDFSRGDFKNAVKDIAIDGNSLPKIEQDSKTSVRTIIKGDSLVHEISAASIVAKEARDLYISQVMTKAIEIDYHWQKNVGYGTKEHEKAIAQYGISKFHRKSFIPTIYGGSSTRRTEKKTVKRRINTNKNPQGQQFLL